MTTRHRNNALPRTGLEHRIAGERSRAATAFALVTSLATALRGLFVDRLPTTGTRQALAAAAVRLSDILARLEVMEDLPEPDIRELETLAPPGTPDPTAYGRALALNVPIETVDDDCEHALDQCCRGDYEVTWHHAMQALARIEHYRRALESIAKQDSSDVSGFARHVAGEALATDGRAR